MKQASSLEELALLCDQAGAMNLLRHFFAVPTYRHRSPCLVMGCDDSNTMRWAVLMYEIAPLGVRTGVYATDDISGFRAVLSYAEERAAVASAAAAALLETGAQVVRISYLNDASGFEDLRFHAKVPSRWASRSEDVLNTLLARGSYEATLMSLGKATRFNMRYYRRRLVKKMRYEFVADARGLFTRQELLAFNANARNPFSSELAWMQYESSNATPEGFVLGLRAEDGRWLGLVGGWRQGAVSVLLWQMNRNGFDRDSIGTVMRSHFLEHEIERGAERIVFYGGTPNSIQNSFRKDRTTELVVIRQSLQARMLLLVAKLLARQRWWLKSPPYLAEMLHNADLDWRETGVRAEQLES